MADDKPIIIIKKKGGHAGHHGGAWKVAYADFTTAMMCFFLTMWLVGSAQESTRENIATYFRSKPGIFEHGSGSPIMTGDAGILPEGGMQPQTAVDLKDGSPSHDPASEMGDKEVVGPPGDQTHHRQDHTVPQDGISPVFDEIVPTSEDTQRQPGETAAPWEATPDLSGLPQEQISQEAVLQAMAFEIRHVLRTTPELQQLLGEVDVTLDGHGLNIEIIDTDKTSIFSLGSAVILSEAQEAFTRIAEIIREVPNELEIIGHTDGKPYAGGSHSYSNWELSADRANAARRLMEQQGIARERITSVVGRADSDLKNPANPLDPANRRITLRMRFATDQKIDLARDPNALRKMIDRQKKTPQSQAAKPLRPPEKSRTLTPAEVLNLEKRKKPLPPPGEGGKDAAGERKRVFEETPVIKPFDIFKPF